MQKNKGYTHHTHPVRDVKKAIIKSAEHNKNLRANTMNRALLSAAMASM